MLRYLVKAFPCCFKTEIQIIPQDSDVKEATLTEIEIKKRFREQEILKSKELRYRGFKCYKAQETAGRFSEKLRDSRRLKVGKVIEENVDDFNSIVFNKI